MVLVKKTYLIYFSSLSEEANPSASTDRHVLYQTRAVRKNEATYKSKPTSQDGVLELFSSHLAVFGTHLNKLGNGTASVVARARKEGRVALPGNRSDPPWINMEEFFALFRGPILS